MSSLSDQDPAELLAKLFQTYERAFGRWTKSLLEDAGVSTARFGLLVALHCKGPQIMCDLSDELGVTPRNVTTLVDGLEEEGLVRRVPHPSDRRATVIEITPAGFAIADQMLGPFHEQITGLFRALSERDRRELVRLMASLLDGLRRRGQSC